jgi:predicted metal-dependent phosphoesterase TrpH
VHVLALGFNGSHPAISPYLQGDTVIGEQLQAQAVVEAIHAADGLALLAHPARYRISFRRLMQSAAGMGFDGAEAWYDYEMLPSWRPSPQLCEKVAQLALDLNLLMSCGTDSHGLSLRGR